MSAGAKAPLAVAAPRRWPRRVLVITNIVVLLMLVAAGSAYAYVQLTLGKVTRISVGHLKVVAPTAPMTILAVGSDSRSLGKGDSAAFGNSSEVSGQRSDTIMLLRVVPATHSIALMSIPRDLLLPVAGYGTTRINAAFNNGPSLLVSTIEQDLGIPVNHFMVVNFYTFTQIADALGGVYQYFPAPARDLNSGLTVTHAGCVLLKGANALGFVRSRYYQYLLDGTWQYQLSPESDLARIQRQQDFVKLAIKKAEKVAPTNPLALNNVLSGIASSLTVDSNFSNSLMLGLASTFRHADVNGIPTWTYPSVNSVVVPGALDPVPSQDQAMVQQFLNYGLPSGAGSPTTSTSVSSAAGAPSSAAGAPSAAVTTGAASAQATATSELSLALDVWSESIPGNGAAASSSTGTPGSPAPQAASGPVPPAAGATSSASLTSAGAPVGETTPNDQIEPDASSFYGGQYIPPGRVPGQVPQQCPS